ncbi:MAG: homocysteine S-methyltransferase family protein [Oscillospiraceae bacterium]|nr:homocysteine S-methyltransferase family protein [Oscillospiraceae bacterium]
MDILSRIGESLLYFDGGLGTELFRRGLKPGSVPDLLTLDDPDAVSSVYLDYLRAGADIINSNTFGACSERVGHHMEDVINLGVFLARRAVYANRGGFVALDLGPTGRKMEPMGDFTFNEAFDLYSEAVRLGAKAGADLINIETMYDIYEAKAAVMAAKEQTEVPVFVSVNVGDNGKMACGTDLASAGILLESLGADAVGVNCVSPDIGIKAVSLLSGILSVPVSVCPSAGLPRFTDGKASYGLTADAFAEEMEKAALAGAQILGGCCGTTPEHINALKKRTESLTPVPVKEKSAFIVSSGASHTELGQKPCIIGTGIDPRRDREIAACYLSGDTSAAVFSAEKQAKAGAGIIAVRADMKGAEESEILPELVSDIEAACPTPLLIEAANEKSALLALRACRGRPILRTGNIPPEKALGAAAKYGAAVMAAPAGKTPEARIKEGKKILNTAKKLGLKDNAVILEAFLPGDDPETAFRTASLIKSELKVPVAMDMGENAAPELVSRALSSGIDAVFADV